MHRFETLGGLAALICGLTYIVGFVLLFLVLQPAGYGPPEGVAALIAAHPGMMLAWNLTIYVVNALALAAMAVALGGVIEARHALIGRLVMGFGLIWATLVLGAGMVANVAVETTLALYPSDPQAAAEAWQQLHRIELGLGGGNEIAGGVWIALIGLAGLRGLGVPRLVSGLGLLVGLAGLATVVPASGEAAGVLFGLGAILWFLWLGLHLLGRRLRQHRLRTAEIA